MTLVPWKVGRCLTWDVTCPDTLAASHRALTSVTPGAAAERAGASQAHQVYRHQCNSQSLFRWPSKPWVLSTRRAHHSYAK